MHRSRLWRNLAALLAALGVVALGAAIFAPPTLMAPETAGGTGFVAVVAILVFGIWAATKHVEVRHRDRLARGDDVLARWSVDPDTWGRFDAAERERCAQGATGELDLPDVAPVRPVDVIVGRGAVQVGDALHPVPEHGNPEVVSARLVDDRGRVAFVELALRFHPVDVGYEARHAFLRFPVPDGSLGAARTVVAHFARETPQRPSFFHGPGDGSDPEDLAKCWRCGFETYTLRSACPQCGATMQSRRWARRFGAALIVLGGMIATVMGVVLQWMWPRLAHPGVNVGGSRFDGSPAEATLVVAILAAVFGFGALAFGYGVFQLATGKRNLRVVQVMLGLVAALVVLAMVLR